MRAALVAFVIPATTLACGTPAAPSAPTTSHAAASTSPATTTPAPSPAPDPLDLSPSWAAFGRVPKLPKKIAMDPYAYFRFINAQFSSVVCHDFADFGGTAPVVSLHGDAHLEQYALTDLGRGFTDFDDMATGPAVIDLVRMTTSLVLVARMRGFSDDAAVTAFFTGYREGLAGHAAPRPSVVVELKKKMRHDPVGFLEGADRMMLSTSEDPTLTEAEMRRTLVELERAMRAKDATIPPWFFDVKKLGPFHAGIGSALDRKFLAHLEGMTKSPTDDRVIELKFVGDRKLAPCVKRRLEHEPTDLRDDIPLDAFDRFLIPTFVGTSEAWAQEWYPNFHEVEADAITEPELREVSRDAGALLAREHVRGASPGNLALDDARQRRLLEGSRALATRVEASWKRFRDALPAAEAPKP